MIDDLQKVKKGYDESEIKSLILSLDIYKMSSPVVANEYRVGKGATRADLVILSDKLTCFEIKSDYDSLTRLKRQMESYSRHFDRTMLVVTSKHLAAALHSCPSHIGIWVVRFPGIIDEIRAGHTSPSVSRSDRLLLLTKAERRNLLGSDDATALLECPEQAIVEAVQEAFVQRHRSSSARFWDLAQQRSIDGEMLKKLSRFQDHRSAALAQSEAQQNFWSAWNASAEDFFSRI